MRTRSPWQKKTLWLRSANGVNRLGGEGEEEGHFPHRKNDTPAVEKDILVGGCVAKDQEEACLHVPFPYLVERKAFCKVLAVGRINYGINCIRHVQVPNGTCHQHEEGFGSLCRPALKAGVPYPVVMGKDVC